MFLNCHTYHSLRYGTISIEELVQQAAALKVPSLVLTDNNTITGIYDFLKTCKEVGIKPIAGVDVRKDSKQLYIAIAKRFEGVGEINRMLTNYNCYGAKLPEQKPGLKKSFIVYPMTNVPEVLEENEFIGIRTEELNYLFRSEWSKLIDKMVILHPVTVSTQREYNLHRILRAVDNNTLLSKLTESDTCKPSERFISPNELRKLYQFYPKIIENTQFIMDNC